MKRKRGIIQLFLLLLLLLVLSLCACRSKETDKKGTKAAGTAEDTKLSDVSGQSDRQTGEAAEEAEKEDTRPSDAAGQDDRKTGESTVDGENDTVTLSPEGIFSTGAKNSRTENSEAEKENTPTSGNGGSTSGTTGTEEPSENSGGESMGNPFDLDKDGDGFADGWY